VNIKEELENLVSEIVLSSDTENLDIFSETFGNILFNYLLDVNKGYDNETALKQTVDDIVLRARNILLAKQLAILLESEKETTSLGFFI